MLYFSNAKYSEMISSLKAKDGFGNISLVFRGYFIR